MSMMALGQFLFGLDTLAYEQLQRATDWRHPANSRVGAMPARQYLGQGEDNITLTGLQVPEFCGDRESLDQLRDMADAGKRLERYEIAALSGFLITCLRQGAHVLELLEAETEKATSWLLTLDGIYKPRIAKNHAQLLVVVRAMRDLMHMTDAQYQAVRDAIVLMARERQAAISADHPLVAEFWEAFDYLDTLPVNTASGFIRESPNLNHSRDAALIAVNLNEFVERASMVARRLTPRECERLQGFPDDYTAIPWRGKSAEHCPDGPRYRALGDSMAVPVMRWIGQRIASARRP
jgi:phage protein U